MAHMTTKNKIFVNVGKFEDLTFDFEGLAR